MLVVMQGSLSNYYPFRQAQYNPLHHIGIEDCMAALAAGGEVDGRTANSPSYNRVSFQSSRPRLRE